MNKAVYSAAPRCFPLQSQRRGAPFQVGSAQIPCHVVPASPKDHATLTREDRNSVSPFSPGVESAPVSSQNLAGGFGPRSLLGAR